eukprot:CAMPEP_0184342178 /NCGR_PEP_ID=MMETSP1089-20130417/10799_1 /TAXON_ID=38269 ORGANISM="Gloeochaete wittrockiana, Strain SAG46.84" /NCGR_SAMPLE_ID=MMETSP1089 /ASSEMBLY_ACC=CAM_ASM_000445 /LENGTH=625 /DNA_ID=CAMNT_0026670903 /DNA_START=185 /DNA_END=2062 /DNA_ORIENTATION=-
MSVEIRIILLVVTLAALQLTPSSAQSPQICELNGEQDLGLGQFGISCSCGSSAGKYSVVISVADTGCLDGDICGSPALEMYAEAGLATELLKTLIPQPNSCDAFPENCFNNHTGAYEVTFPDFASGAYQWTIGMWFTDLSGLYGPGGVGYSARGEFVVGQGCGAEFTPSPLPVAEAPSFTPTTETYSTFTPTPLPSIETYSTFTPTLLPSTETYSTYTPTPLPSIETYPSFTATQEEPSPSLTPTLIPLLSPSSSREPSPSLPDSVNSTPTPSAQVTGHIICTPSSLQTSTSSLTPVIIGPTLTPSAKPISSTPAPTYTRSSPTRTKASIAQSPSKTIRPPTNSPKKASPSRTKSTPSKKPSPTKTIRPTFTAKRTSPTKSMRPTFSAKRPSATQTRSTPSRKPSPSIRTPSKKRSPTKSRTPSRKPSPTRTRILTNKKIGTPTKKPITPLKKIVTFTKKIPTTTKKVLRTPSKKRVVTKALRTVTKKLVRPGPRQCRLLSAQDEGLGQFGLSCKCGARLGTYDVTLKVAGTGCFGGNVCERPALWMYAEYARNGNVLHHVLQPNNCDETPERCFVRGHYQVVFPSIQGGTFDWQVYIAFTDRTGDYEDGVTFSAFGKVRVAHGC